LEENKRTDVEVINTTPFSVSLHCKFFERNKTTAIRGAFDNLNEDYLHVSTYHCEPQKVKPYHVPA